MFIKRINFYLTTITIYSQQSWLTSLPKQLQVVISIVKRISLIFFSKWLFIHTEITQSKE